MSSFIPINMELLIPLVTGGGSGIGLGLVTEFIKRGSPKVLITGRRQDVLEQAALQFPGKVFFTVSDAASVMDRENLLEWVKVEHPDCNALVNNAGIQRRVNPVEDAASWEERMSEIEINFCAPIHLCTLFAPYFLEKKSEPSMIINVTSGLAFVPLAIGPVYSATKAGVHNYTAALRHSFEGTSLRLVEIVPPAVKSNLGGSHAFGEECDEFCGHVMSRIADGELEVGFKFAEQARQADRITLNNMSNGVKAMMPFRPFTQSSALGDENK
jgi:uncharacterized oxidoreductase